MPSPHETAYPRLKFDPSGRDLRETATPTAAEVALADSVAKSEGARLGFLVTLKTFQRLGYFVYIRDTPAALIEHIARCLGYLFVPVTLSGYDTAGTRQTHIQTIRTYQRVKPFGAGGHEVIAQAMQGAAQTREDLRDLINAALEELTRHRYELPGFTTLEREARRVRREVNQALFEQVHEALSEEERDTLEALLLDPGLAQNTLAWQSVKREPKKATLTNLRDLVTHHEWLAKQQPKLALWRLLPEAKLRQFAADAKALDAARMRRLTPAKRLTYAAALLHTQAAKVLDDLGELFSKRLSAIHRKGKEALAAYQLEHQGRADALIRTLHEVVAAYERDGDAAARLGAITTVIGHRTDLLKTQCAAHEAYADNNYLPFLWRFYASHRPTLFKLCRVLPLRPTTQDKSFQAALEFLLEHEKSRADWLLLEDTSLDLSWLSEKWWDLVMDGARRCPKPERVKRRPFEVCIFTQLVWDLKSGDTCIDGSLNFADYRAQLIDDAEYEALVANFGKEVGLPLESKAFVAHAQAWLTEIAQQTDLTFPANDALSLENGKPKLKKLRSAKGRMKSKWLARQLRERLESVPILDALADTENLLHWSQFFGPHSGYEAKLESPRERYVSTTFCYGCNLGPSQTARSLAGLDRRQLSWVNQRHVSEEALERARVHLVNAYNRFSLPKLWGSGRTVSADGTKWDLYEQNLLAEYHIRYGGYGGIGYYHVSDTYIALFSRFIPCGVYEAVYILDGLLENESDIQPDTVHSDTHGQNAPVFGLAYLLGIDLMPRIRDWQALTFVKPDKGLRFEHIDDLFTDTVDWHLIERHLPDMLRIVLSIKAGRISASTILKRLSSYSRKNHVYQAFRELGRVVRTGFLLRYIADPELRGTIQAALNKSEQFNAFLKWLSFGGDELRTNDRELQQKLISYNHLVANCLIYHNVMQLTRVVKALREEGHEVSEEALAHLNPYLTEHINRLGEYHLDLSRVPPEPDYEVSFLPAEAKEGALYERR